MLSGALVHADDHGHQGAVVPGTVQVLSAGSGVVHAEVAHDVVGADPLRPGVAHARRDRAREPAYATAAVALPEGELVPGRLRSPSGRGGPDRYGERDVLGGPARPPATP